MCPEAEDKTRIATTAADKLCGQSSYLSGLVTALPEFKPHLLGKKDNVPTREREGVLDPDEL